MFLDNLGEQAVESKIISVIMIAINAVLSQTYSSMGNYIFVKSLFEIWYFNENRKSLNSALLNDVYNTLTRILSKVKAFVQ